jgi:hypothetical protein
MKLLFGSLGSLLLLCQCTVPLPGRADGIDPNPFNLLEEQATAKNRDASRISVPVLSSPALEKRWGKPKLLVGPKGGYALRYQDPGDANRHLTIFGSPQLYRTAGPIPPPYTRVGYGKETKTFSAAEVSQSWRKTRIVDKDVRFCIAEANFIDPVMQFSTETFRLTAPDGRTASYRIRSSSDNSKPEEEIDDLMRTLSFERPDR